MKRIAIAFTSALVTLALASCASTPPPVYPPIDGTWMYDYAASFDDSGQMQEIPQEWLSELKQDPDATRDELLVLKNPPELILIERTGMRLSIMGGGRFERVYFLDGAQQPGSEVTITATSIVGVHTKPDLTLIESWEVSRDLSTLVIRIRAESPKLPKPLEIRRVFRSSRTF